MLFLMNNFVLQLEDDEQLPPEVAKQFWALTLTSVSSLGGEQFAKHPVLPSTDPERARRLAALIRFKAPMVNAALFVVPSIGCPPEHVSVRYADVGIDVMAALLDRQHNGMLTTVEADRLVWRRLAA